MNDAGVASTSQNEHYSEAYDYVKGSPHLRHQRLKSWIVQTVDAVAEQSRPRSGKLRVLEIGAGHGHMTERLAARGAEITVTEMSAASAAHLNTYFAHNDRVTVVHDPTGDALRDHARDVDLVLAVSVLHHIEDYVAALTSWSDSVRAGGSLLTFADPLWYPRRSRRSVAVDRGLYLLWRVAQGDLAEGVRSVARRRTGRMDENNERDMVEYHVLRQGCDELAISDALRRSFTQVDVLPYWSTQSPGFQRLGEVMHWTSSFGIVARSRRP